MDILSRVNWVDILVIIVVFRMSYVALQDGLSHEIFPLVASICTAVISLHFYKSLSIYVSGNVFISFVILVTALSFIFKFIRAVLDKIIKVTWHPVVEKFGGLIAGVVRASIMASIILITLAMTHLPYFNVSIKDKSLTGMYFLNVAPKIYETVLWAVPVSGSDIIKELTADKPAHNEKEGKKPKTLAQRLIEPQ